MLSRRDFLKAGSVAGGSFFVLGGKVLPNVLAQLPGGTLDPTTISKYVNRLVIPPVMPPLTGVQNRDIDRYAIAVRQFPQQILPAGMPATTVWGYGSAPHRGTFNYPAFTIEARVDRPVRVKWINDLVDRNGRLPAALAAGRSHAALGQPAWWDEWTGHAPDVHLDPRSLHRAGADRDPPARGPQRRGERRVRRGLVPARTRTTSRRAMPGSGPSTRSSGPSSRPSGTRPGTRDRGVPVRERPAGLHDLVPRPHAGDDPRQRLRGAGRLLPPAGRAVRPAGGGAPGARPEARRPPG